MEKCKSYLEENFQRKNISLMAKMPIKPLSLEFVEAALEGWNHRCCVCYLS